MVQEQNGDHIAWEDQETFVGIEYCILDWISLDINLETGHSGLVWKIIPESIVGVVGSKGKDGNDENFLELVTSVDP